MLIRSLMKTNIKTKNSDIKILNIATIKYPPKYANLSRNKIIKYSHL